MNTYIAFLRGINVGGHKKVLMSELRDVLSNSGLLNVKTYIQSGNVVFQSLVTDSKMLQTKIKTEILNHFGYEVFVLIKTRQALNDIFQNCPFSEEEKVNSYFAMLSQVPNKGLVLEASKKIYVNDIYHIKADCIYFFCPRGYGKAKFNVNYFERKLNVNATARNYKTMLKLLDMAQEC